MSSGLSDTSLLISAAVLVFAVPGAVLGLGEIRTRLALSGSRLMEPVSFVRSSVVPTLTLWAVGVVMGGLDRTHVLVRTFETFVVIVATLGGLKLFRALLISNEADGSSPAWRRHVPQLLLQLPRLTLVVVGAYIVVDSIWGLELNRAFAALGVGSLVIALALQDTFSGLVSGLLLMADRPFQPGDWIEAGDVDGQVVDIRWRTVRVRTRQNTLIVVPNSVLASETITNKSAFDQLHRLDVDVDIAYASPPAKVMTTLLSAVDQTDGVLAEPAPNIAVTRLDDPLMGYQVQVWIDDYGRAPQVISELRTHIYYQAERDGVPLPSPAYDLYHFDGPATADAGSPPPTELHEELRRNRNFRALRDADVALLAESARVLRFTDRELVVAPDQAGPDLFVIRDGVAAMHVVNHDGTEAVFDELYASDVFGVLAVSGDDVEVGVRAIGDCTVLGVMRGEAFDILNRYPAVSDEVTRATTGWRRRARRVRQQAVETSLGTGESVAAVAGQTVAGTAGDGGAHEQIVDRPHTELGPGGVR